MKKIVCLLLSLLLILSLVSCKPAEKVNANDENDSASQVETPTQGNDNEGDDKTDWPNKNITIIVPYAAGGSTDMTFRTLGEYLSQELKVNVVIENKEGGGGSVGLAEAALAKPDGYTFSIGMGANMCIVPRSASTGYTADDFTPIAQVSNTPLLLAVNKSFPADTLEDFIEYAKNNDVTFSSAGANSTQQLTMNLFGKAAGFQATHVPNAGAPAAVAACIGEHVDAVVALVTDLTSSYESDELKILCAFDEERVALMPDVPTAYEKGFTDLTYGVWYSLVGPKGIDPAIVKKLDLAIKDALDSDYVKQAYEKMNVFTSYLDHEALAKKIKDVDEMFGSVLENQ